MGKYLGREAQYGLFDTQDISSLLNGTLTTFNLNYKISSAASILVIYSGDVLQPEIDYTIIDGGTKINFDTAYPNGLPLYITYLGKELATPSAILDGDRGDIIVTNNGITWTIDSGAAALNAKLNSNAYNTSLTVTTGTLTIDYAANNSVVLGTLSAAVTTWAFTNIPTTNSRSYTITTVLLGNAAFTYGDACSINGTTISGGILWSGGTPPTATANTDIITFTIVRDSAGTFKVFGSAITNFS
jgi:hypothetical protein